MIENGTLPISIPISICHGVQNNAFRNVHEMNRMYLCTNFLQTGPQLILFENEIYLLPSNLVLISVQRKRLRFIYHRLNSQVI